MAISTLARDGAALPAVGDPLHAETILHSHERCAALGLSRIERPDHAALIRSDLAIARERNLRLHLHAAPVMELLLEQTMATQSMVVLTDAQGTVLHSVGHDAFLQRASKVALAPGANWSESSKGTNAIGTALVDELPTVVHAGEHYMHANGFLTCSAAPIFDPRGNMLGVLDVSGDHQSYHMHTMGLVKMSARMIENHWLSDDFRHALRLHFHSRPEFIGTLMEGIVAVGRDGKLLGANRGALDQLAMSGAALRMNTIASLFSVTVGAVIDHFRSPMAPPMAMVLPNGQRLHMRAVFNWPTWHALGSVTIDAAGDEVEAALNPGPAGDGGFFAAAAGARTATGASPAMSGLRYLQTGDAQMEAVITKVRRVLNRDISVLVLGETGTGKELLARAIHHDSERSRYPFVAVNCASIPENLIEAELFGYEDGAFTGARRKGSPGKILQANGGTLFLDEIGDMPLSLQARLLRVLQERQVTPLGSAKSVPVDVAVVSATHRALRDMIGSHTFREDLYYRLNGLVVRLPPLRERSDLMTIVRKILRAETNGRPLELEPEVVTLLQGYHWPGNIRQLTNVLRTAAVMAGGEMMITRSHLSDDFLEDAQRDLPAASPAMPAMPAAAAAPPTPATDPAASAATLEEMELRTIQRAVDEAGGNISVASRRLGISRNTIYRKLRWKV
ncbi:sigma-54-dependent Fis family transcriptional regulator [Ideonella sp.]|uniref:sigma-54-dependent Fis family transcriptional regulator n=1 Tax=Ideonella sp. TaxID=1929293 RepID=UPI002B490EE9|nr:sigma-54-dependent Fis family transcriptional regulator [Ideonella sp.]HJV71513.1 sigma-54-dependent Fis family transcriptional regulator [Ideonella sp.]